MKNVTFTHQFILDRQYYTEVYQQTATPAQGWQAYKKAMILLLVGLVASSMATTAKYIHLSYFVIGLAVVDALSVRFAQTWWLWRQLISKAANNPVNVEITEQGITITSAYLNQTIEWGSVTEAQETEKGFIFTQTEQRHYLSKFQLAQETQDFIRSQCKSLL